MPLNPHVKGGSNIPVTEGGTGASDAATGLSNLGGLDSAAHAVVNHAGIPGVGDLTTVAHSSLDHTGITGVGSGDLTIAAHALLDHSAFPHSFLNIGSATAAGATGDLSAGDGTRDLFWDASAGALGIRADSSVGLHAGRSIHVQSDGTFCRVFELETSTNTAAIASVLFGSRSRGIPGTPAQVQDGDLLFAFNAAGYLAGAINNHRTMAGIRFYADGVINESTIEQARISFETVTGITNAERWTIRHDGHLLTGPADNTYDIGAAGATRPRTGYFGTALNVGNGITPSTANGDMVIGNGTASLTMDASAGSLNFSTSLVGTAIMNLTNTSSNAVAGALLGVTNDSGADLFMFARSSAFATPNEMLITTNNAPLTVRTGSGGFPLTLGTASTERWQITSTGHFIGVADNTYDFGAAGATRPRTAYIGTALNVGNGITPSAANGDAVFGDGTRAATWDASAGTFSLTGIDATAAGGHISITGSVNSNVRLNVTNSNSGTAATSQMIFSGNTASMAFEVGSSGNTGTFGANACSIQASGGSSRFILYTNQSDPIEIWTNNVQRWLYTGAGHLTTSSDNSLDIGAAGATRPRTGYFGTALNVGNGITPSAANGDIVAGISATNTLEWDASTGYLNVGAQDVNIGFVGKASIQAVGSGSTQIRSYRFSTDATRPLVMMGKGRGTPAVPLTYANGDGMGCLAFQGFVTGVGMAPVASIEVVADGVPNAGSFPGRMTFWTTPAGGFAGLERWAIPATGHFISGLDNTYDIGATGATRPRTGYFGTSLVVGATVTVTTSGVTGSTTLALASTGSNNLTLQGQGTSYNLSASGAALTTTAQDIVGAINEVDAAIVAQDTLAEILSNGNTTGANDIIISGGQGITGSIAASDVATSDLVITGMDAFPTASTNVDGADVLLAGGIGKKVYTVVSFGGLAGDTATIIINGVANVLTEGSEWTAATSNDATATSLASAIDGLTGVSAVETGAVINITPDQATYSLTAQTSDFGNLSLVQGAAGRIFLGTVLWAETTNGITVSGSGQNLNLTAQGGGSQRVNITSSGTGANAIDISSVAGGIDVDCVTGFTLDASNSALSSITSANTTASTNTTLDIDCNNTGATAGDATLGIDASSTNGTATINIGVVSADAINIGVNAVLASGADSAFTFTDGTIQASGSVAIRSNTTSALILDSGTTGIVSLGTGANAKTITLGNVTGATAMVYNAGTAGHVFTGGMGFFGHAIGAQPAAYTPSNVAAVRTYDADATTLNALADVVGTIIADLQTLGLVA